ncbi:MAG: AAA family ATPase, partial [Oscillibacter sp.]
MKIHRLSATFGRLQQETLELGDGLNIVQAPNETGKSTWCALLAAMLYGVNSRERDRAGFIADKNRFAPWSGAAMAGRLDCRVGRDELTLTRETRRASAPMGEFTAVYAGTGDSVPGLSGQTCGETLLGVSREVFERSAFIRQAGLSISQDPGLERRIAALITTGEEDTSYSEAADTLKKQLNRRRHNKTGLLPTVEAELADIQGQLQALAALETNWNDAQRDAEALLRRETALTAELALHDRWEAAQVQKSLEAARVLAEEAEQAAQRQRSRLEDEGVPENDGLARLRGAIVNLETVRRSVDKAREERDAAMKAVLQADAAVHESIFAGRSGDEARKEAATPPKVQAKLLLPALISAGLLLLSGLGGYFLQMPAVTYGGLAVTVLVCWRLCVAARGKARRLALEKRFGTAVPAEIAALAEAYCKLLEARETAQSSVAGKSAVADSLYASLSSNEQAILLEVRRFAPAAFTIPAADAALRDCALRRRALTEAETAAR